MTISCYKVKEIVRAVKGVFLQEDASHRTIDIKHKSHERWFELLSISRREAAPLLSGSGNVLWGL